MSAITDFKIENGVLKKYKGKGGDVTVPDGVTSIGDSAFWSCSSLTSITIPESVTSIGDRAFSWCSSLTSITIPNGVTSIGSKAFEDCKKLTSITIPDSVTSIGDSAFSGCSSLTSITIPDGLTSIGDYAFCNCSSLTSITLPDSVTSIDEAAFHGCLGLADLDGFVIFKGILFDYFGTESDVVIPDGVTSIGDEAFSYCKSLTSITIPDSVTSIGDNAFYWCKSLTSITIPNGVTSIGDYAFAGCKSLKSITIPDSVTSIGDSAFSCCESLTSVTIPESVTSIGGGAFEYCESLKSVTIPDSVTSIGDSAFEDCKCLTSLTIPESVTSVGDSAFSGCSSLTSITLPEDITSIDKYAFEECKKISQVTAAYKAMLNCKPVWKQILKPYLCSAVGADEETVEDRVRFVKNAPKGKRVEYAKFLLPIDSKSVAALFEELGLLDEYAAAHNTDADTLRDSLLSDFGMDINGCRSWPLAGSAITAKLNSDLTLTLTDASGKVLKSVPKKNADPAEYDIAKKETAQLKKDIVSAAKLRNDRLLREFLSGREKSAEAWKSTYLVNPLLRLLARLLVWQQGESTFTLREDGTACDVEGNDYEISGQPVFLAHPMELGKETTEAWQKYFLDRGLKQPFEQVWEPVADAESVKAGRYDGCTVPLYTLMNKEKHGIIMEGQSRITLKDCSAGLKLIEGHSDWYNNEFEITDFTYEKFTRQVNHIVVHLDKATVAGRIKKDDTSVSRWLHLFTAAQITEFIDLASESEATNCTALLLDYKNRTWPDIDPFAGFTLDLL